MPTQAQLLQNFAIALQEEDPHKLAGCIEASLGSSREWAAAGHWSALRLMADALDDLLAAAAPDLTGDAALSTLTTLARQVCVILALLGDANGVRDSGYFRASLAHARRLDAMTEARLGLVDLVNLVRE